MILLILPLVCNSSFTNLRSGASEGPSCSCWFQLRLPVPTEVLAITAACPVFLGTGLCQLLGQPTCTVSFQYRTPRGTKDSLF